MKIKENILNILIILCVASALPGFAVDHPDLVIKKERYIALENTTNDDTLPVLYMREADQIIDLSVDDTSLAFFIDLSKITKTYPNYYRFEAVEADANHSNETFLSATNLTILNKKLAANLNFNFVISFFDQSYKEIHIRLFDKEHNQIAEYKTAIEAHSQNISTVSKLSDSKCGDSDFGECQLEYIFNNFSVLLERGYSYQTNLHRDHQGKYKLALPYKSLGKAKSSKRKKGKTSTQEEATYSEVVLGSQDNYSALRYWKNTKSLAVIFNAQTKFTFSEDAYLGIGVTNPEASLDIGASDGAAPSIKLGAGTLTTTAVDGAIEYDGTNLYFTIGDTREQIALGEGGVGPTGPAGAPGVPGTAGPAGPAGSFSGGDATINGVLTFVAGGMLENAVINGTLSIPGGATNGYLLTTDANGNASWQAPTGLVNQGSTLTDIQLNGTTTIAGAFTLGGETALGVNSTTVELANDADIKSTKIYANGTELISMDKNGVTSFNGLVVFNQELNQNVTGASSINWLTGNKQKLTLTGDVTLSFTDPTGPTSIIMRVVQDATGGHTITWPASVLWSGGIAPTLSSAANAKDIVSCYFVDSEYYCKSGLDFQ